MWTVNESGEYVCKFIYIYIQIFVSENVEVHEKLTVTREHRLNARKNLGQESSMEIHIFRAVKHAQKLDFFFISFAPVSSALFGFILSPFQAILSVTKYSQIKCIHPTDFA